jgi:hypothetical protein
VAAGSRTAMSVAVASESVPPSLPGTVPGSIVPESVPLSLQGTVPDSVGPESVPLSLQGAVPDSVVPGSVALSLPGTVPDSTSVTAKKIHQQSQQKHLRQKRRLPLVVQVLQRKKIQHQPQASKAKTKIATGSTSVAMRKIQ